MITVNLTGSEKQILYAQAIVDNVNRKTWGVVERANDRVRKGTMPEKWAEIVYDCYVMVTSRWSKIFGNDAKKWIENKDRLSEEWVFKLALQKYDETK